MFPKSIRATMRSNIDQFESAGFISDIRNMFSRLNYYFLEISFKKYRDVAAVEVGTKQPKARKAQDGPSLHFQPCCVEYTKHC